MSRSIPLLLFATFVGAAGCRAVAPPIRIESRPSDLAALVGDWHGEYVAFGAPSRQGSISFTLEAGDETATGAVVMIPGGSHHPFERYRGERDAAEVLSITMVRVEESMVRGVMDPYWDPDRQCIAYTRFYGFIQGRTIAGTFRTTYSTPLPETTGRWRVMKATTR